MSHQFHHLVEPGDLGSHVAQIPDQLPHRPRENTDVQPAQPVKQVREGVGDRVWGAQAGDQKALPDKVRDHRRGNWPGNTEARGQ